MRKVRRKIRNAAVGLIVLAMTSLSTMAQGKEIKLIRNGKVAVTI
tara:strand:- start:488 stop:622 length:135 start_codon:yes stop_codon:yes gene_type:complete